MSDSYVECLVKAKQPTWAKILKVLLITLTVLSCLVMFVFIIFLPVALAAGVGAYFLNMYTDLEYEYLYLDKELSVDKIMAKSKRKRVGTYSLDRMEVFAPVYSYHLDNFKNNILWRICAVMTRRRSWSSSIRRTERSASAETMR